MTSFGEREQRRWQGLDKPLPEDEKADKKKRLTIDEIMDEVSRVAQDDSAGADKFRALKMLASMETTSVVLPEPMADGEVVQRLARVMVGCGSKLTQVAYTYAFPYAREARFIGGYNTYADAPQELKDQAKKITSLTLFNRRFPEHKVHGVPKGFPSGRSFAVKSEWCQQQALKVLVETSIKERERAHLEMTEVDHEIRTEADGHSPTG